MRNFDTLRALIRGDIKEKEMMSKHTYYGIGGPADAYVTPNRFDEFSEYQFTIDWASPEVNEIDCEHSEIPQEHKCAHILALDNGNYAAQPNNRILWSVSNYTTDRSWPDYKVQNTYWTVENKDWTTEDTDKMFYQIEEEKDETNS